jgi:hypothetical protein
MSLLSRRKLRASGMKGHDGRRRFGVSILQPTGRNPQIHLVDAGIGLRMLPEFAQGQGLLGTARKVEV